MSYYTVADKCSVRMTYFIAGIWILLISLNFGSCMYYADYDDDYYNQNKALDLFKSMDRRNYYLRQPICNSWNRHCLPWSNEIQHSCCGGLACKCNLWGQNCRCTTQLWGRWLDSHLHVTEIVFDFHGFPFRTSRLGMNNETLIRNRLFIFCFYLIVT